MITYELTLERQNLIGADRFSIAAESNKTVSFRFHFDRSWRIFDSKAAVFKSADCKYYVVDIIGGCVKVPWEVLRSTNGFELAVVAYEDEVVMTSKKVKISVVSTLLPDICKQLSPTETLFDRLAEEAKNKAFLEYKDEIRNIKRNHEREVFALEDRIEAEKRNAQNITIQKDLEINELKNRSAQRETELQEHIITLKNTLKTKTEKAANWELIDRALSGKTTPKSTLWGGGSEDFALPILNTSSIVNFSSLELGNYVTAVGFNVASATTMTGAFSRKGRLEEVTLKNTENVVTFNSTFFQCSVLKKVSLDNPMSANNLDSIFMNCPCLEYVYGSSLGKPTTLNSSFCNCKALKIIYPVIDASSCTVFTSTFQGCYSLEEIRFAENSIKQSIDFSSCVNLSKDSILNIVDGLCPNVADKKVTINEHAFLTNLTANERSEVYRKCRTEKGWEVSMA